MTTVGVRELKSHLSDYLARAKAGEVIVVTDRGNKVAQLSPVPETAEERVRAMVSAGRWDWAEETPAVFEPVEGLREGVSIAQLIVEERDESARRFEPKSG